MGHHQKAHELLLQGINSQKNRNTMIAKSYVYQKLKKYIKWVIDDNKIVDHQLKLDKYLQNEKKPWVNIQSQSSLDYFE